MSTDRDIDAFSFSVHVNGNEHVFNLELMIDAASGGCVGASIRGAGYRFRAQDAMCQRRDRYV